MSNDFRKDRKERIETIANGPKTKSPQLTSILMKNVQFPIEIGIYSNLVTAQRPKRECEAKMFRLFKQK